MNAIDFLIKEHNNVRTMLATIAEDSHQFEIQKKRFHLLAKDLIRHENMEHEAWYPYFKNALPEKVKHLLKEEKSAEKEIKKIKGIETESTWKEHFINFKKDVEHHAEEEEQKLFPEVQKILSTEQLRKIGNEMLDYKKAHAK